MASDRVAVLARHLASGDRRAAGDDGAFSVGSSSISNSGVARFPASSRSQALSMPPVDAAAMEAALDPDPAKRAMRRQVYSLFEGRPDLLPACVEGMRKEEHRDLVRRILRTTLEAGYHPAKLYDEDLVTYFFLGELLALVDLSTTVKTGVQYSLWGGSVLSLGTKKHRDAYYEDIDAFRLPGCFAMTELGHGSNVAGLQTEAVLDVERDEWVITTPDDGAIKWWIGNAAEDGQAATVFARLKIPPPGGSGAPTDHGVHAFVVPIRDGRPGPEGVLPGVQVMDCGYKVGLQGVDNGALRFTGARVPRENLLDRFARVERGGAYSSPHSPGKRFAATLGELTGGRVGLSCSSLAVLKGAVTIAVRYSATRTQFGPPGGAEVAVLDYPSQQEKLMPLLATAYGAHFASRKLAKLYADVKEASKKRVAGGAPADDDAVADVHCLSAGLKAYVTAFTANALSVCRAACGGHGYAAANRMGAWRSDHDIFQTFEGDNTVLLQQVAGLLLKRYGQRFQGGPLSASTAYVRAWAGRALPANPLLAHDTAPSHLRDASFLRDALRHRVRRLLSSAAARLAKHSRGREGAFAAWNRCVPHLLHLANAHVESVIYDELSSAASSAPADGTGVKDALKMMADAFALQAIEADVLYRNDDYVAADKAKAISRELTRLRRGMRSVALALVEAFAIPDHVLRAPIGVTSVLADPYRAYLRSTGFEI